MGLFAKAEDSSDVYHEHIDRGQRILLLKSKDVKENVISSLDPKKVYVVASGRQFVVIRIQRKVSLKTFTEYLNTLEKNKNIKEIVKDEVQTKKSDCLYGVGSHIQGSSIDTVISLGRNITDPSCTLAPRCKDGANPQWGRMIIGADLADSIIKEEIEKSNLSKGRRAYANVSVIDSGFDLKNQKDSFENVKVLKGHNQAGRADIDPDGHGTAVSGMISGKDTGVTKHVNLSVYRVTEDHANGTTSKGFLAAAIEKACQHSDIVNLSWGSRIEEAYDVDSKKLLWFEEAQKRGCLVIKSAGNSGVKKKKQKTKSTDPIMTVASNNYYNEESSFSTKGDISAPGEGVYTTLSSQHEYGNSVVERMCHLGGAKGTKIGPINGTSFSSPSVAGVAGQVVTLLKVKNLIPKKPKKKISLIKRILWASSLIGEGHNGAINGLGAISIVQGLKKNNVDASIEELAEIGQAQVADKCQRRTSKCSDINRCEAKKNCTNDLRFKSLVCKPRNVKDNEDLFSSLEYMGEEELLLGFINTLPRENHLVEKTKDVLLKRWSQFSIEGKNWLFDYDESLNIMNMALSSGIDSLVTRERFEQIIRSTGFSIDFNITNDIGSNVWEGATEKNYADIVRGFAKLPDRDQKAIIEKLGTYSRLSPSSELGFLYVLSENKHIFSSKTQKVIDDKVSGMAQKWLSGDLNEKSSEYEMASLKPIFDMFYSSLPNGRKRILEELNSDINQKNYQLFNYVLSGNENFSKEEVIKYSQKVFSLETKNDDDYLYLKKAAVESYINNNAEAVDHSQLKKFLLDNHEVEFPSKALSSYTFLAGREELVIGGDQDFISSYTKGSIDKMVDYYKENQESSHITRMKPLQNYFRILNKNAFIEDETKEGIRNNSDKLYELIRLSSDTMINGPKKNKSKVKSRYEKTYAESIIKEVIKNADFFETPESKKALLDSLESIHDDMLKHPSHYSQTMRQKMGSLFTDKEEDILLK